MILSFHLSGTGIYCCGFESLWYQVLVSVVPRFSGVALNLGVPRFTVVALNLGGTKIF
jgi:hypothetical protein